MAKAENKTTATAASVDDFLATVADPARRADCERLRALMQAATGEPARLWGPSIVGFGLYRYRYESGREGEWMLTGFSPRKSDLTLYLMAGVERHADLLARLGPHKTGRSCLYLKRLANVDMGVLETLVQEAVAAMAPQRVKA